MKYIIHESRQYRKAYKKVSKSGRFDLKKLNLIINTLAAGKKLEERYRDHKLTGSMKNFRECHIVPNLLLMYEIAEGELMLILLDLGSHTDLFE